MAWEPLGRVEARFQTAYASAGKPKDMAVFVRYESEGRLHCEVTVYFSPAAADLTKLVEARPCARPSPEGLSLLLGADASWATLFPERDG